MNNAELDLGFREYRLNRFRKPLHKDEVGRNKPHLASDCQESGESDPDYKICL